MDSSTCTVGGLGYRLLGAYLRYTIIHLESQKGYHRSLFHQMLAPPEEDSRRSIERIVQSSSTGTSSTRLFWHICEKRTPPILFQRHRRAVLAALSTRCTSKSALPLPLLRLFHESTQARRRSQWRK